MSSDQVDCTAASPPGNRDWERAPHSFVDAGDVHWRELEGILRRVLGELATGQVLELVSGDAATLAAVPGWCGAEGHTLIHQEPGDGVISFWLGKR